MKTTIDELLSKHSNLSEAVSILIEGLKKANKQGVLSEWDIARKYEGEPDSEWENHK